MTIDVIVVGLLYAFSYFYLRNFNSIYLNILILTISFIVIYGFMNKKLLLSFLTFIKKK